MTTQLLPAPPAGLMGWYGPSEEARAIDETLAADAARAARQPGHRPQYVDLAELRAAPVDAALTGPLADVVAAAVTDPARFVFWDVVESVFGRQVPAGPQSIGNCVGYSAALCISDLSAREILVTGDLETFRPPFVSWLYGIGRVYVGGNRIRGDGSLGDWQIAAAREYGVLPRDLPGLPAETAATGRQWGSSRQVLDAWKAKAAPYRIGSAARVTSWDALVDVVLHKKLPCTIASDQGFERMEKDTAVGKTFGKPVGTWAHQMHVRGVDTDPRRPGAFVGNQWGLIYDQLDGPKSGFWVDAETVDRWLAKPGTYCTTYEAFAGYPQDRPDWGMV